MVGMIQNISWKMRVVIQFQQLQVATIRALTTTPAGADGG